MKMKNKYNQKKGQLFSVDAITAIGLFMLLISAVMLAHGSLTNKINNTILYKVMEGKAEFITDAVYKNTSTAGEFKQEELINLFSKNSTEFNDEYDIGFIYLIKVVNAQTNQIISLQGTQLKIGSQVSKPSYSITTERFGYLNNQDVKLTMKVYYNE